MQNNTSAVLEFEFLTGRYHATEWGRNVNEGMVDWPPSPWRILRAIISSWKIYANNIDVTKMEPILNKMCKSKVSFSMPHYIQSHTRHYMPIGKETEKVIDSFIIMNRSDHLYVKWDMELSNDEENILKDVTSKIRYLGRAESWCKVKLTKQDISINCIPLETNGDIKGKDKVIDVMIPKSDVTLADLCTNTNEMYKNKRLRPNGSRIVQYIHQPVNISIVQNNSRSNMGNTNVIRYLITGNVRPKVTEAIRVGDFIKRVAMSIYGKKNKGEISHTLSGKDSNRKKLSGHQHAFYLPTDEDGDNILDHITIIAKKSFNEKELDALNIMNDIRYRHDARFGLVYQTRGNINDFNNIPLLKYAKKWESITPLVLNRHVKFRGSGENKKMVDGPVDQIRDEIKKRFGEKIEIKHMVINDSKSRMKTGIMPIQFKRWRREGISGFGAFNVQIEFTDYVQGPLSLGHGSHFGLGLFLPTE